MLSRLWRLATLIGLLVAAESVQAKSSLAGFEGNSYEIGSDIFSSDLMLGGTRVETYRCARPKCVADTTVYFGLATYVFPGEFSARLRATVDAELIKAHAQMIETVEGYRPISQRRILTSGYVALETIGVRAQAARSTYVHMRSFLERNEVYRISVISTSRVFAAQEMQRATDIYLRNRR